MDAAFSDAPLTYVLLMVTSAISLYALFFDHDFLEGGIFHVDAVKRGGEVHRLATSAFLHADPGHLLLNMLTLFFFGPAVEMMFGTAGLAAIYIGSQAGAKALAYWQHRRDPDYRSLGASGAISGVLVAFCVVQPMAPIYIFFALPMPAILFAVLYIGYSTIAMGGQGRIAHEAHLGGALAGAALGLMLAS